MMPTQLPFQRAIPITMRNDPDLVEGSRAFSVNFDFTSGPNVQNISINSADIGIKNVQTIFIDNSLNSSSVQITLTGINQKLVCPAGSQGFFPILQVGHSLNLMVTTTGAFMIPVSFINQFVDLSIWSVQVPGTIVGTVTVLTQPYVGAWTSHSSFIATGGTSQNSLSSNTSRKRVFVENPYSAAGQNIAAAESLYINFTGAAGVDIGTSIEILPGGSYDSGQGPVSSQAMTINAATTAHKYICWELN